MGVKYFDDSTFGIHSGIFLILATYMTLIISSFATP